VLANEIQVNLQSVFPLVRFRTNVFSHRFS